MRYGRLILLAVLVAALGAWIILVERHAPTTDELKERQGKVFPALAADDVVKVEVSNPEGSFILDRKSGSDEWMLRAPIADRADSSAVTALLSSLEILRSDRSLAADDIKLADYGLENPALSVKVTEDDGTSYALQVGNELPLGKKRAARTSSGGVVLINAYQADDLEKGLDGWRSKDLVDLTVTDVSSMSISSGDLTVQLVRDGEIWRMTEPVADLADQSRARDLVGDLNAARIEGFVDDPGEGEAMGVASPTYRVTVARKGDAAPVTLAFGRTRDENGSTQIAVQRGERLYWVRASAADKLAAATEEWRSHTLVALDAWAADALKIETTAGAIDLRREDGVWKSGATEVDYGAVSERIRQLSELEVLGFESVRPQGDSLGTVAVTLDDGLEVVAAFFPGRNEGQALATVPGRTGSMLVDSARAAELLADPSILARPKPTPVPTGTSEPELQDES